MNRCPLINAGYVELSARTAGSIPPNQELILTEKGIEATQVEALRATMIQVAGTCLIENCLCKLTAPELFSH